MVRRDLSEKLLHLPSNTVGRDLIVGDIHGCYDELMHAMALIGFNRNTDRLFCTGDLIDRGPKNFEVLDLLYEDWFYSSRGNHDEMMIQTMLYNDREHERTWVGNGGMWKVTESPMKLGDYAHDMEQILPMMITVGEGPDRFNIVHAELMHLVNINGHPERVPVTDQMIDDWTFTTYEEDGMLWGRRIIDQLDQTARPMYVPCHDADNLSITYVGHSPMDRPVQVERHIYLDGGGVYQMCPNRWLTNDKNNLTFAEPYKRMFHIYSVVTRSITTLSYDDMRVYFQ